MKNIKFQSQLIAILITFILILGCDPDPEPIACTDCPLPPQKNLCPIGKPDNYTVQVGKSLEIDFNKGVLSNDEDPAGGAMSASIVVAPQAGTLTLNKDGSFTYKHNGTTAGEDQFVYVASNSTCDNTAEPKLESMAKVTITIIKDDDENMPPTENIYVSGSYWNSLDDHGACYWTDKNHDGIWETNLIPNSCGINDITVLDGDVYVVGDDNKERATIWKNGKATILKTPMDNKSWASSFATGIAIHGNDIYVSGNYLWNENDWYRACYWKNGQFQTLDKNSEANGIAVKNGVPITVGHTYKNGKKAVKWVGKTKKILHTQGEGEAWDVVVDEFKTTHITGNASNDNNKTNWFAAYWRDDNPTVFLPRGNKMKNIAGKDSNGGNGDGITTYNGLVYIGGNTKYNLSSFPSRGWWPSYWRGNFVVEPTLKSDGTEVNCNVSNFSCEYGKISDIEVKNGNVFAAGMFTTDLGTGKGNWKPNAAIWINDKRYQIIDNSSEGWSQSEAFEIFIE